jgi:hypothetical protein
MALWAGTDHGKSWNTMNNNIIQKNDTTYMHIDDWYIGVHLDRNGDLMIFLDHEDGKVVDYNEVIAEDDYQWGKAFHVVRATRPADPLPLRRTLLRSRVRVEVTQ